MPELPASVRLSLWTTHAWATGSPLESSIAQALPDIDHVAGDLDRLGLWHDLGEQALLVALPAPGDLVGMPGASPDAQGAAAASGECVFVPALGGVLVPTISTYGADSAAGREPGRGSGPDVGTRVDWTAYDADPVPRHRVEALEASQLERHLREEIRAATEAVDAIGGQPFGAGAARELADAALGGRWGLPPGLPGRPARVIALAGTIVSVVDVALAAGDGALTATESGSRQRVLQRLQRASERALADATNAACAVLAGWRPA
ncbi:hypothetical protein BJ986_002928 [Phycicoccus badiiscoriae]|uniref:Uncharacterized protein n=1 Tax=Pedococcus badiiscoriae TaxID=642776 RepID=A0A852WLE7_9MICO|nr:hypothetical protein [Pedococcus badiiscoriae]NYG08441.1 hypothetical protein [Pedococcus badiiscoriae]